MRTATRIFGITVCALAFALWFPVFASACSCDAYPPCSGTYCYCSCSVCTDVEPIQNPCLDALQFNASRQQMSAFQQQIDLWSRNTDLQAVAQAATELYHSVLFQDRQAFAEANETFRKAVSALSPQARLSFVLGSQPVQNQRK